MPPSPPPDDQRKSRLEERSAHFSWKGIFFCISSDVVMVVQAKQYASRLAVEAGDSHRDQIGLAFRLALCRDPDPSEQEALESLAVDYGMENVCRLIFNLSEFTFID